MTDGLDWFNGELRLCECDRVSWLSPPFNNFSSNYPKSQDVKSNGTNHAHNDTSNLPMRGLLILTNFRLRFIPDDTTSLRWDSWDSDVVGALDTDNRLLKKFDVVLYNIDSLYKVKHKKRKQLHANSLFKNKVNLLEIVCKSFQVLSLGFEEVQDTDRILYNLIQALCECNSEPFFSQLCPDDDYEDDILKMHESNLETYWKGLLRRARGGREEEEEEEDGKGASTIGAFRLISCNEDFHVTDSLPKSFIVPSSLSTRDVIIDAPKFVENRYPFWSYSYPGTQACLVRMACKVAKVQDNVEERIFKSVQASHPANKYPLIFDLNSLFPSYHDINHAYLSLQSLCTYDCHKDYSNDSKWLSQIEGTHWLTLVSTCLSTAHHIATAMSIKGLSVIIKEWNSSVLSPLISCLVQLMLEPSARHRSCFERLVSREWLSLSARFAFKHQSKSFSRNRHTNDDSDQFPVFLLFLDCVHQLLHLAPTQFSFNDTYLIALWTSVCCGLYRDLLFNSAKEMYCSQLNTRKHSFHLKNLRRRQQHCVTGTLMRKRQVDFPNVKKATSPMHESYNGGLSNTNNNSDGLSLDPSKSTKSSLLSLNISSPPSRKHSLMTTSSPNPSFMLTERFKMLPLYGLVSTKLAANLWDWNFIFRHSQLHAFDNIPYLASNCLHSGSKLALMTSQMSLSSRGRTGSQGCTDNFYTSAKTSQVSNGFKDTGKASIAHLRNLFFLKLNFSLPFLSFWSECYLKHHPHYYHPSFLSSTNPLLVPGILLPSDPSIDPFKDFTLLRVKLLSMQQSLQEEENLAIS